MQLPSLPLFAVSVLPRSQRTPKPVGSVTELLPPTLLNFFVTDTIDIDKRLYVERLPRDSELCRVILVELRSVGLV